jgi:cardiolipin synthase (CMP-forming)
VITLPLLLTLSRVVLAPYLTHALLLKEWLWGIWMLFLAGCTDMLDGALARHLGQQSALGACLDPLADKLLMIGCYAALFQLNYVPWWFVFSVICKEILLLAGAALYYFWGRGEIRPSWLGKVAMLLQLLFVGAVLCSLWYSGRINDQITYLQLGVWLIIMSALVHYGYFLIKGLSYA